jgi:murein DD-endopeptidase MepM/ murein hydrolase activator NlpD
MLSDAQVAGLDVAGARAVKLEEINQGKTIISSTILEGFGDTVVSPVLMNGLDSLSDLSLFGGSGAATVARTGVASKALDRYDALVRAKQGFYNGTHQLFAVGDTANLAVLGRFGYDSYYPDNQHKGIDIAGQAGTDIYSMFGGKVVRNDYTESAGNTVVINLGFGFENFFYETGVQEQFMHLGNSSSLSLQSIVDGATLVGDMGHTGSVRPVNGGDGTHLHYQLMGDQVSSDPYSQRWNMYQRRRDTFLNFAGSPLNSNWSNNLPTSTSNFWAGNRNYLNYYYNTNGLLRRMGIDVAH